MKTVLITGARAPVALDLARSFAAAGYAAHLADSLPARMARASRMPAGVHRIAPPALNRPGFRGDIAALVQRLDPVLIVPTCEEVFHLAAAAAPLRFADRLFAPPSERLARLHGKGAFAALCDELGLPVPATRPLLNRHDIEAMAPVAADLVFKPEFGRFGERTLVSPTPRALAAIAPNAAKPWVAQNRIRGDEVCLQAICRDGTLTAFAAYRPLRRLRGGASFAFAPSGPDQSAALQALASRLAHFVGTGQFACDAIFDAAGKPWLIECNPRATSGLHLFGRGPELAHAFLETGNADVLRPDGRPRRLAPAHWLFGLPGALAGGGLAAWAAERRAAPDVISAPGDGLPVLGALADSLGLALGGALAGRSMTAQSTVDIEWNGGPL
jgi:hypothetical protein